MASKIIGYGPPTDLTVGVPGQTYVDEKYGVHYMCIGSHSISDYFGSHTEYDWRVDPNPDTSYKIKDFDNFCAIDTRLEELPFIDTSEGTNFRAMFSQCTAATSIPFINTSKGVNFTQMFGSCTKITEAPEIDTSNGEDFSYMFNRCGNLLRPPKLNVSKATTLKSMYAYCSSMTEAPELDAPNCNTFSDIFNGCSSLTSISNINTSKGAYFEYAFYNCANLKTIENIDMSNAYKVTYMFDGLPALENLYIYNVDVNLTIGNASSGTLLTVDSLVHTIKELRKTYGTLTLTMGEANIAKLEGLYCRVLDDTTKKMPMELCESTDDGAMTLTEYAALKNWVFA